MMREYKFRTKFRVWNKKDKKMINGIQNFFSFREFFFDKNIVVEQSTGLKDKNGKEIYEGDILDNRKYKSVVEFYGCGFSAKIYFGGKSTHQHFDLRGEVLTSKIVGDIHNNPDLLEVSN